MKSNKVMANYIDKVQKIKEWIQTRKLCTMDEHMKFYCKEAESDYNLLCSIEKILNSLQEEPKKCMHSKDNYTDEDRKVLCENCEEECKLKQKPTEDTDNPDNLHQYLYGDTSILGKVRAEIKKRYEHHLGCMEGSRDDTYPEISHAHHCAIKTELFEILCFLDVLEGNKKE